LTIHFYSFPLHNAIAVTAWILVQPMRQEFSSEYSSNHIIHGFAVYLLADRLYSKSVVSPANLQHFATNGFVYNIFTCRDVADMPDKSVVSPANLFDVV
jgi:hypothetical protein